MRRMQWTKRKSITAVFTVVLLLAACGSGTDEQVVSSSAESALTESTSVTDTVSETSSDYDNAIEQEYDGRFEKGENLWTVTALDPLGEYSLFGALSMNGEERESIRLLERNGNVSDKVRFCYECMVELEPYTNPQSTYRQILG
jgi:hypothetical protein